MLSQIALNGSAPPPTDNPGGEDPADVDPYDEFAASIEAKRSRVPAADRDLLARVLAEAGKTGEGLGALAFPGLPERWCGRAVTALVAGEAEGDLYLHRPRQQLGIPARAAGVVFLKGGRMLSLPGLRVFEFASEDSQDASGRDGSIAAWGARWHERSSRP
jgi:hypothetical protein